MGGCTLHVAVTQPANLALWALGTTDASGGATSNAVVPAIPALYAQPVTAQAFALSPTSPLGFDTSNGIVAPVTQ